MNINDLLSLYFLFAIIDLVSSIQINYIKVPNAVKNDSGNYAILDCNYSIRPEDNELVVKWFLNDEVVYQWIPPQKPQSLGLLKNRIDINFRASDDPKSEYRALKIRNPTTDIAGEYKCFVSTFADEDFSAKNMVVFEVEKSLVILKDKPNNNRLNFTCVATDVYPAPKLTLYKDQKDEFQKNPLQTLEWNTSKNLNGKFTVFIVASASLDLLEPGSIIHCEMRIPGTGYVTRRSTLYYPPIVEKDCGDSVRSCCKNIVLSLFIGMVSINRILL